MGNKSAASVFWGWYIVAAAFFVLAINYGSRYCFGVFVKPLAQEYGWSRSVISLGASLNMLIYSACAVVIGRMMDRVAPRWIVTGGAVIAALGFLLTAQVRTPWQFYLIYGLLLGVGSAGMGVVTVNSSVGKWFIRKRGTAIGLATMGMSFGTISLTPLAGLIVKHFDWRAGFIALGLISLLVGVSLSQLFLRKVRPEDHGFLPDGEVNPDLVVKISTPPAPVRIGFGTMIRDGRFRTLACSFGLAVMVLMSVFVHQVAFAIDQGIGEVTAAASLGVLGLAGFAGQFFFGWLSDRLRDPKYASFLGMSFMLAGLVALLQVASARGLFFYAYIVLDIWDRSIVGWAVHAEERTEHSEELFRTLKVRHAFPGLFLHADNGGPMKGATVLTLFSALGITPSFSRPRVSDDNPYSESLFSTMKRAIGYPAVFDSLETAREWIARFVDWYNSEHLHSAIGLVTPYQRRFAEDHEIFTKRNRTLLDAYSLHPERWSRQPALWTHKSTVILNPAERNAERKKKLSKNDTTTILT